MNLSLLKVQPSALIGGEAVPAVNLRDLHQALGVSSRYNDWALRKIEESMAVNGRDYLILKSEYNLKGGRPQIGHLVTIDTAKHIAMLERNEKGRQIREYFIRIEKEFRAQSTSPAATALLTKQVKVLTDQLEHMQRLLTVRHAYGSMAGNGKQRTGYRGPAFVAAGHRVKDARAFHEGALRVNVVMQLDLPGFAEVLSAAVAAGAVIKYEGGQS